LSNKCHSGLDPESKFAIRVYKEMLK